MRKLVYIWLMVCCSSIVEGQSRFGISDFGVDTSKMTIGLYGEYGLGSTALTNRMYMDFLRGNYVEREVLDKASRRLVQFNKAGGDVKYGLYFSKKINTLLGKAGFSYFVNVADRIHWDVLFTDDLFNAIFYGNKSFEGDTAKMGTFAGNFQRYQQLQLGLIKVNENKSIFGMGVALLKGQQFYQINIARANLYTSALGLENELDLAYSTVESDPNSTNMNDLSGWGTSIDAFYQVPYYILQNTKENESNWKGYLRIEASDLGFIRWNDSSRTRLKDSVYHNEGIFIPTGLAVSATWAEDQSDSLKQLLQPETFIGSFASILPGSFHLKMYQANSAGLFVSMGTVIRLFAKYSPMMYLGGGKKFSDKLSIGGTMEFGGYGRFNLGFEARSNLKNYEISLGSRSLGGWLFPMRAGGNSAYISLKKKF